MGPMNEPSVFSASVALERPLRPHAWAIRDPAVPFGLVGSRSPRGAVRGSAAAHCRHQQAAPDVAVASEVAQGPCLR
jgi:hypothetical protein